MSYLCLSYPILRLYMHDIPHNLMGRLSWQDTYLPWFFCNNGKDLVEIAVVTSECYNFSELVYLRRITSRPISFSNSRVFYYC